MTVSHSEFAVPAQDDPMLAGCPDLTISIISADNLALLLPCLRSVFSSSQCISLEVFVVDNASADDTGDVVQAEFPQVQVIRNAARLGFSSNNNLVLQQGRGRYLMLLNDDTLVLDGALDGLVAYMEANHQAGVVGSYLLNPDYTLQPSYAAFPNPLFEAVVAATNWVESEAQRQKDALEVDSVSGAAMVVRRAVIEQVGPLDTAFDPIYSEEVDWCYRIKKAGWQIYSLPTSKVVHYGSVTMNRAVPQKYELLLSHKMLFFRKHMGTVAANVYRLTLGVTTAGKVLLWSGRGLIDEQCLERRDLHRYLFKRIWQM
jgi:GT2 family glycosyltransferase